MSDGRGSRWSKLKNLQTALRPLHEDRSGEQPRAWEREREDPRPPAIDPPPPSRPAYGYPQHHASDPGPSNGFFPGYTSPPPSAQGSPPSQLNQHYLRQNQAGSSQQAYGAPPQPIQYQSTHPSQAYGPNQGYITAPPPASHPPHFSGYQQQHMSPANQSYQGGQSAYQYSYSQPPYRPAGNSYSPPLPPGPHSQGSMDSNQSPAFARPSYPAQSSGESLGRTPTAPPALYCEHTHQGNGLCRECAERYYERMDRR